ncbi:hypothetical protein NL676_007353 [Syzygium grande]|nr:hypothetical protein NL676_007353 [Syzygium grande]
MEEGKLADRHGPYEADGRKSTGQARPHERLATKVALSHPAAGRGEEADPSSRPGAVALWTPDLEYRKSTELLIWSGWCSEIAQDFKTDLRFQSIAVAALQEVAEDPGREGLVIKGNVMYIFGH